MSSTDPKETETTLDIENAGGTAEVRMHGATILSMAIRGDAAADYVIDARLTRSSAWVQDVGATYSASADYDDVIETGYPYIRVRCTTGTATAGDQAIVTLSAGGG